MTAIMLILRMICSYSEMVERLHHLPILGVLQRAVEEGYETLLVEEHRGAVSKQKDRELRTR